MIRTTHPLSHASRQAIFKGDVFVSENVFLSEICTHVGHMLRNAFFGVSTEYAHDTLSSEDLRYTVLSLRKSINEDTAVKSLLGKLLSDWGASLDDIYIDALRLRLAPPVVPDLPYPLTPLPAHRDTWGSNIMQQINIWVPLNAVPDACGLMIWPRYFSKPVENDSATWDLEELQRLRKTAGHSYPLLPTATTPPTIDEAEVCMPKVGEALVFSGAHLHASVPNDTQRARLNLEFRIVVLADQLANEAAANVDGAAPKKALHWFKSFNRNASLADHAALPILLS